MLDREELESALKCKGNCYECKMPIPDEEYACEHLLAKTAIAQQQEIDELIKVLKMARETLNPYLKKFDDGSWAEICPVCKAYLDEKHINHFEWCKAKQALAEIDKVIGGKEG